jgi:hypothetical protein
MKESGMQMKVSEVAERPAEIAHALKWPLLTQLGAADFGLSLRNWF